MNKPSIIKIITLALASILLVSAIGFTGYYYFNYSVNAGNKEVADFNGMSKNEIEQYLVDNSIKEEYVVFTEEYSEEIEAGNVISQSINPGEGKYKDILTIVISKGYDPKLEVELPDISNLVQADIEKWFEDNRFSNVSYEFVVVEDAEEDIPYGKVVGLSKIGKARRDEAITVSLADEKIEKNEEEQVSEDDYITIVDFKGFTLEKFADWTHSRGLKYYVYEVYSDDYKKGEVMSQSPKAGEKAKKGSTVTLRMSLGPSKKMDNLVGKTQADAEKYTKDNNIKLKVLEEYSRTVEKGKIIKTSPASGDKYTEGDTLTITVSKGSDIIKLDGSYVGKSESDLLAAVKAKYSSVSFRKAETYSDKTANTIISHDSEISLTNPFVYTLSLGSYNDTNNYAGKTISDVKSVINSANSKGANVKLGTTSEEITRDSSLNGKIKGCSFANSTYTCVVYKYEEPSSTFVAGDFAGKNAGDQTYQKDGNTYNIKVTVVYTDSYTTEAEGTFNGATCSTGNIIKNGSVVTVVLNKGPKPIVYGGEITWNIYQACEIPDDSDNPTFDKVKSAIIEKLTNSSYGYTASQIQCIPDDSNIVGYIDIDNSSKGKFVVGEDTIKVYIGTKSRGE